MPDEGEMPECGPSCAWPAGRRTTGLFGSTKPPGGRDMTDPAGDIMPSRPKSLAMDDLLLIATLGEYMLPPNTLVLRLEYPPIEPNPVLSFVLPKPC